MKPGRPGCAQLGCGGAAAVLVLLFFVGMCSDSKGTAPDTAASTSQVSTPSVSVAEYDAGIGQPVTTGYFTYQVGSARFASTIGNEFTAERADGVFLLVKLAAVNNSQETRTLDAAMFTVVDSYGTVFEPSTRGNTALQLSGYKTFFLKDAQPRVPTGGIIVFEVPTRRGKYSLKVSGGMLSDESKTIRLY